MGKRFLICFSIGLFLTCGATAQQTANYQNNWHFGINAGMNFSGGAPTNFNSGITAGEVSTCISDGFGNTLFYSAASSATTGGSGFTVWDASNTTMPNGDIDVDFSSSCGLITAPVPGSCDQYYIFHLAGTGTGWGLFYSVVDMTLPGNGTVPLPLGDIVVGQKDVLVYGGDDLAEKIEIVQKGSTENYWVITRSLHNDNFYVFEVTSGGVNNVPVTSVTTPTLYPAAPFPGPTVGWLAASPDRSMLAEANGITDPSVINLFSFDNNSGIVTFGETLLPGAFAVDIPYGVEFSPNSEVLYASWIDGAPQTFVSNFDLTAGFGAIGATQQDFLLSATTDYGAFIRGKDGKIYGSEVGVTNALTVINDPNNYATPNIVFSQFSIAPNSTLIGMANMSYYFHPDNYVDTLAGNDRYICIDDQAIVGAIANDSIWATYSWEPSALVNSPNNAITSTTNLTSDQQYIVYVISNCGDTITSDTTLVLIPTITPTIFTPNSWYCVGDNITPLISDAGTLWYDDAALTNEIASDSFYIPPTNVSILTYYVIDTTGGCSSLADSVQVEFANCSYPCGVNQLSNGDFELFANCPTGPNELDEATDWLQVQTSSNDYFNCGYYGHPSQISWPPIAGANTGMFFNPSGTGYVGMVIEGTGIFAGEGFGQEVNLDKCVEYTLQIRAATDNSSPTLDNGICIYGGNVPTTPGTGCMDNYDVLACLPATDFNLNWNVHTFTFTPTQDYTYIAISGECPSSGTLAIGGYLYMDDLFLCADSCANMATLINPLEVTPEICTAADGSGTVDLTYACYTSFSFAWEDVLNLGPIISTDSISTGLSTGDYNVTVTDANNCSLNTTVTITNTTIIVTPPIAGTDAVYCEGDIMIDITATAGSGGTLNWYSDAGLTNNVGTGATFTPTNTIGATIYYVTETVTTCESVATSVTITINAIPTAPVAGTDATYCEGDVMIDLTATAGSGGTLNWYSDVGLTTNIGTGTTLTPGATIGTTPYHVTETVLGCESAASIVTITINALPVITLEASTDITDCLTPDGTITITANGTSYELFTSGGVSVTTNATGAFTALIAGDYYVVVTLNGCSVQSSTFTINNASAPVAPVAGTDATYCDGDLLIDLTATAGSAGTLNWYDDAGLTNNVGTGATLAPTNTIGTTIYYATETVTNCESVATLVTITINAIPTAPVAGTDATYCAGDVMIDLTATAGSGGTLNWYSDAGLTTNIGVGTTLTPGATIGTTLYYVTETLLGCESAASIVTITINALPVIAVEASTDITDCLTPDGTVTITASGTSYELFTSGGVSVITNATGAFTALNAGVYYVVVSLNGCTVQSSILTITNVSAPSAPIAGTDATYCDGDVMLDLTATAGGGGILNWFDDVGLTNNIGAGVTLTPTNSIGSTIYYVTETLNNCESAPTQITVTISAVPVAPDAGIDATYCEGDVLTDLTVNGAGGTFNWYDDAGLTNNIGSGSTLSPSNTVGITTYYVTETNGVCEGLASTVVISIVAAPSAPVAGTNANYCEGDEVIDLTATAGSGGILNWFDDVGLTNNVGVGTTLTPGITTTTYYVTETVGSCVSPPTLVTITFSAAQDATILSNPSFCVGDDSLALFSVDPGGVWTGVGITNPTTGVFDPALAGVGVHQIIYTISGTCGDADTIDIPVSDIPDANLLTSYTIDYGGAIILAASGGETYAWDPTENLSCDDCQSPIASPEITTVYCVTVVDSGCVDTACTTIVVEYNCGEVAVPTAFTPNSSDVNSMECVLGACVTSMHFRIYDRWGELVFESLDQNYCWDGTHQRNGKPMSTGVFVYQLEATLIDGTSISQKGNITLIR